MAGELWMLVAASFMLQWVARAPEVTRDERDREVASSALGASCYALLSMQAGLVVWISLATQSMRPAPTLAMLAHLFICSWMAAHVFYGICCMKAYAGMRATTKQAT